MIRSMTGFGEARCEEGGQAWQVEIRSFNQRYLKTTLYLPDEFAYLETEIDRQVRARLTRGSVTLRLHVRSTGAQAAGALNTAAVAAYVEQLRNALPLDARVTIDVAALLALPGVCETPELLPEEREQRAELITRLTETALDRLVAMRTTEGQALAADLARHCEVIRRCLANTTARAPVVVVEYRDRLKARIDELLAGSNVHFAAEDLLKEVSIYAERSDISEELSRLAGHLEQFAQQMAAPEPTGRKLEFIAQEMLREANTMGSKTGDAAIAREIIEIKSAIDRIKEQVQNAE
ncbi:MAG: YicC/YloC family endoribonuclease [Planctomycetota bacterium]